MTKATTLVLDNGLIVCKRKIPGKNATLAQVYIKTGYANEYVDPKLHGHAHFVEHMIFKGTKKKDQLQINLEADLMGGSFNAFTDREQTALYIETHKSYSKKALNLLKEMLFDSTFPKKEVEREKPVIVEEMKSRMDSPETFIYDALDTINYEFGEGKDITPVGTTSSILGATRDSLYNYYKTHYRPDNMILCITGNTDELSNQDINNIFGKQKNPREKYKKIEFSQALKTNTIKTFHKDIEQIHFMITLPSYKAYDFGSEYIEVVDSILNDGMSSRLFQNVRDKKGYCYSVGAFNRSHEKSGLYVVSCSCSPEKLLKAVEAILKELKIVSSGKFNPKELLDAKQKLTIQYDLKQERSGSLNTSDINSIIYTGKPVDYPKDLKLIEEVKTQGIIDSIGKGIWSDLKPSIYAIGKIGMRTYKELEKVINDNW